MCNLRSQLHYSFLPSSFVHRLGLTKRCNKLMACRCCCCCTPFLHAVALCCIHAQKNRKGKNWMLCYVYFVTPQNAVQCNADNDCDVSSKRLINETLCKSWNLTQSCWRICFLVSAVLWVRSPERSSFQVARDDKNAIPYFFIGMVMKMMMNSRDPQ